MLVSLRHPGCARPATPLDWHGQPLAGPWCHQWPRVC